MDAISIIADWKRRLIAMADNPPYVFRDTPQLLIDRFQRRLTTFDGYSEQEVAAAESRLGVQFPQVFRTYLKEMGKSRGELYSQSFMAGINEFEQFRTDALSLIAETDPNLSLPSDAVVFLLYYGNTYVYFRAVGGFEVPTLQWIEPHRKMTQVAPTFALMVDGELQKMQRNQQVFHEQGGFYLTLHPDGGATQTYPALAKGERPLGQKSNDKQ
jgi:hypothetical protein